MEGVVEEARWDEGTPVLRLGTNLVVDLSAGERSQLERKKTGHRSTY